MTHKILIATVIAGAVLLVGTTVGWAASGTAPFGHHMKMDWSQMKMDPDEMRSIMTKIHPGLDKATTDKLIAQCTKAMGDGTMPMHGSGDMSDHHNGSGGMMGGSGGMMGG